MVLGFASLFPNRQIFGLTRFGVLSLYIYLLHFYVLRGIDAVFQRNGIALRMDLVGIFERIFIAAVVWALIGSGILRPITMWAIEPPIGCIFIKEHEMPHEKEMPIDDCCKLLRKRLH